ncbi:MAG TPA: type 4a pilus biogenesis protein PilO [Candidatus Hydrogenedentes bacterium]|nr:type 4a pilus biogenesis protein PilO [Candidatus Hydrogenedentota bacterium]HPC15379.1 type 4a pilus biogenesis protein PilO [Candidatus Hydrogenedentota bacterium]HRT19334.1 type 4a pilus biogenesis protein PilO [Candidatus Hydrogenedentota bacterium]HRT63414.1 type 4a pilus biogenesis protein PilO [Candidatus Hydrogenedentota bacterium]
MMDFLKGTVTPKDWMATGIILAVAAGLCAGYYFVLHARQAAKLQEIEAADAVVVNDLRLARETEKNIDKLRVEAAKMQELTSQFEQRLPESREIPTLLRQFEGFAGEIGLRVELSQLPRVTDEKKETIPYSVVAKGNFHQIVTFINRLERFQRYLKISELNIGKMEEGIAEASFTLSTYRFIQPSEGEKKS